MIRFLFVLLVLVSALSSWAQPIRVSEAIQAAPGSVRRVSANVYEKYTAFLGSQDPDAEIESEVLEELLRAISYFEARSLIDFSTQHLFKLIEFVRKNKGNWKGNHSEPYEFWKIQGKPVLIHLAESGEIFFDFHFPKVGDGAVKSFHPVARSGIWEAYVKGALNNPRCPTGREEMERLKRTQEDLKRKVGGEGSNFPAAYFGVVVERHPLVFQVQYSGNLLDSLMYPVKYGLSWNLKFTMDSIRDLAQKVDQLHSARYLHGDFKPENILVGSDGRMVLCDFGFAYAVEDWINSGLRRPNSGTAGFAGPEIFESWQGESIEKKIENTLKLDIYSLMNTAYCMLNRSYSSHTHLSIDHFNKKDFTKASHDQFISGLLGNIRDLLDMQEYDPFRDLAVMAWLPDPVRRVNSTQFLQGIDHVIQWASHPVRKRTYRPLLTVRKPLGSIGQGSSGEVKMDQKYDEFLRKKGKIGGYLRGEIKSGEDWRMGIYFLGVDQQTHVKIFPFLSSDSSEGPEDDDEMTHELDYLKSIGYLSEDLTEKFVEGGAQPSDQPEVGAAAAAAAAAASAPSSPVQGRQ